MLIYTGYNVLTNAMCSILSIHIHDCGEVMYIHAPILWGRLCVYSVFFVYTDITLNYKGMLQEFLAKRGLCNPQYSTRTGYGGRFVSTVSLTDPSGEEVEFEGQGYANKKSAEQSAAKQAYTYYTQM